MERHHDGSTRIVYENGAVFKPFCSICGKFVKPDETTSVNEIYGLEDKPNATCKKCGRTNMIFEGFL